MKKFFSLFLVTLLMSIAIFHVEASAFSLFSMELIFKPVGIATDEISQKLMAKNNIIINEEQNAAINVFNYASGQLKLSEQDIDLMAKLVYAESRGEPFEGKVAVASVVLNRVISPSFPSTVREVIFQKNAFSCVINGEIKAYPDQICYDAVYQAIRGTDPTNEALFFYNPVISTCSWMKGKEKVDPRQIGNHLFFKTH